MEDESRIKSQTLTDDGLTTKVWGDGVPEVVMLHDGLGSIAQWGDVPGTVAGLTGLSVLAYERSGHGSSLPVPSGPWPTDWLHSEAEVLHDLLHHFGITRPLIVGHSDGGSIALIHEAKYGGSRAVLTLAAHTWVEDICFEAIVGMRAKTERFVEGLTPHHDHPNELFEAWSGVWVSDAFRTWDIRPDLHTIACPTWVAQGSDDEYASQSHTDLTAAAIGANATPMLLDGGVHLLHYRDPQMVIDLTTRFVARFVGP